MTENQETVISHVLMQLKPNSIVDEPTIRKYVDVFKVLNPMSAAEEDEVIKELHTRLAVRMDRGACLKEKDHVSSILQICVWSYDVGVSLLQ